MSKKPLDDENALFRDAVSGIKPLQQDKFIQEKPSIKEKLQRKEKHLKRLAQEQKTRRQASAEFEFSDGYEAYFDPTKPLKYTRSDAQTYLVKQLRRGDFPPDLLLDLHGYNRADAKLEIAGLIHTALKEQIQSVCVMHGLGKNILKASVPNWLVQHPKVLAFHQAPLEWGGQGAILILLDVP
jgi:DNA-nicking Smr family endonuclease